MRQLSNGLFSMVSNRFISMSSSPALLLLRRAMGTTSAARPAAHSGLQREVLSLYKAVIKAAKQKDPNGSLGTVDFARAQFRSEVSQLAGSFLLISAC